MISKMYTHLLNLWEEFALAMGWPLSLLRNVELLNLKCLVLLKTTFVQEYLYCITNKQTSFQFAMLSEFNKIKRLSC